MPKFFHVLKAQVGITIVGNPGIFGLKCPEIKNRGSKGVSDLRISFTAASDLPAESGNYENTDGRQVNVVAWAVFIGSADLTGLERILTARNIDWALFLRLVCRDFYQHLFRNPFINLVFHGWSRTPVLVHSGGAWWAVYTELDLKADKKL
jgi:hypothetical protein